MRSFSLICHCKAHNAEFSLLGSNSASSSAFASPEESIAACASERALDATLLAEFAKAHVSVITSPATSPLSSSSASHSPQRDWVLSGGITTWLPEVGLIPIVSLLNHPAITLCHERR